MSAPARGRRKGAPDTRSEILAAARELFAARGFRETSLRAVAGRAGVDPALVHHYFAGKEDLFIASLDIPVDPRQVLAAVAEAGPDGAGERLLRALLGVWEDPTLRLPLLGLARRLTDPSGAPLFREGFVGVVLVPLGEALGLDDPTTRMPLVASQIIGLVLVRYLLEVEPVASLPVEDVVAIYAPTLQRYLTGDLAP